MIESRYQEIDVFKGILTIQMVLAHCLQFFVKLSPGSWEWLLSEYINLTTFSGFMFAFGFASQYAYIDKPYGKIRVRVLMNFLRMLAAYYISAFSYRIFIELMFIGEKDRIADTLLLRSLAGYSEFLLSFGAVMLIILLFQPLMQRAGRHLPAALCLIALAACLLPLQVKNPIAATFVGRAEFPVFAVVPYFLYFAFGVWTARSKGRVVPAVSFVCSVIFLITCAAKGEPSRFPLSVTWLIGASGFVWLYYQAAIKLKSTRISLFLENIGQTSLFYLLISNFLIFALKSSRFYKMDTLFALAVFVVIMLIMRYWQVAAGSRRAHIKR